MTHTERLAVIEHRIGINKDGALTGNGLTGEFKNVKMDIDLLHDKINRISVMQTELSMRFDILENELKELTKSIDGIKDDMRDNINCRTIKKSGKTVIGVASFLTALAIVGAVIVKIFNLFRE